jgi:hypothetical protein
LFGFGFCFFPSRPPEDLCVARDVSFGSEERRENACFTVLAQDQNMLVEPAGGNAETMRAKLQTMRKTLW